MNFQRIVVAVAAAIAAASPAYANLVQNGGFETGDLTDWPSFGFDASTTVASRIVFPGTTVDGGPANHTGSFGAVLGSSQFTFDPSQGGFVPDTVHHSGIFQVINGTTAGITYRLTYFLKNTDNAALLSPADPASNDFRVFFGATPASLDPLTSGGVVSGGPLSGGTAVAGSVLTDSAPFDFIEFSFLVTATSTTSLLEFDDIQNPAFWALDDISLEVVAEPGTGLLLAAGLVGVTAIRRRIRSRAALAG